MNEDIWRLISVVISVILGLPPFGNSASLFRICQLYYSLRWFFKALGSHTSCLKTVPLWGFSCPALDVCEPLSSCSHLMKNEGIWLCNCLLDAPGYVSLWPSWVNGTYPSLPPFECSRCKICIKLNTDLGRWLNFNSNNYSKMAKIDILIYPN